MNLEQEKYRRFALVKEMLETVNVVRNFDFDQTKSLSENIRISQALFLGGEGSSRIFPAKNTIRKARNKGLALPIFTEGSRQAMQYYLTESAVLLASNSGRTREVVELAEKLRKQGNERLFGLTAQKHTKLEEICKDTFILSCGPEQAVAATKSVVEQALFYESLFWHLQGTGPKPDLPDLAQKMEDTLNMPIDPRLVEKAAAAPTIYFAGFNDGVAEELTLKTNEITRKKSDYLEGTYAVHGIEEVMCKDDVVFVVDPIRAETDKFKEVLINGVGMQVVAIASEETPFPTIRIPDAGSLNPYLFLTAGWNVLVEVGTALGINLDKPERARKVGNEID